MVLPYFLFCIRVDSCSGPLRSLLCSQFMCMRVMCCSFYVPILYHRKLAFSVFQSHSNIQVFIATLGFVQEVRKVNWRNFFVKIGKLNFYIKESFKKSKPSNMRKIPYVFSREATLGLALSVSLLVTLV